MIDLYPNGTHQRTPKPMTKKTVKSTTKAPVAAAPQVTPASTSFRLFRAIPLDDQKQGARKAKKIAAVPDPLPTIAKPTSKRVTVGAAVTEWRIVASQRKGMPGYFLQGRGSLPDAGEWPQRLHGRRAELFFEDRATAAATLAANRQRPPPRKPEALCGNARPAKDLSQAVGAWA